MTKSYGYQSVFDIIRPVMMGPSSPHTAGAVKTGNLTRVVLGGMSKHIEIRYYESLAKTRQGHGTDVVIVEGVMGYSTFDSRIKLSLDIAEDEDIAIDIIEDEGENIDQHPNRAYIKANTRDGRHIEVIGTPTGDGIVKLKGINVNGLDVELNHGFPMLAIDGNMNEAKINRFIDGLSDMNLDPDGELIKASDNGGLVVLPLNKATSESALNIIKDKHSDLNVSYVK